ncbi:MAG: hypothetical protein LBQ27_00170, partial [Clostridiales bacterium]|nr:hypothetical protein [Clostridiales bacterium]
NEKKFDAVYFLDVPEDKVVNPPEEESEETNTPNLDWLYITSGVIGGVTVIIILVYIYQRRKAAMFKWINDKIFKGRLTARKSSTYDRHGVSSTAVKETRKEYDSFKED